MAEVKTMRLNKVLREFNISLDRAVEFLSSKGFEVESRPTTKITGEEYQVLFDEFQTDKSKKVASKEVGEEKRKEKEEIRLAYEKEHEVKPKPEVTKVIKAEVKLEGPKTLGKIDLDTNKPAKEKETEVKETPVVEKPVAEKPVEKKPAEKKPVKETPKKEEAKTPAKKETTSKEKTSKETPLKEAPTKAPVKTPVKAEPKVKKEQKKEEVKVEENKPSEKVETKYKKLDGPKITGEKIDLSQFKKPEKKKKEVKPDANKEKRSKRRRISKGPARGGRGANQQNRGRKRTLTPKEEPSEAEVQKQVRETLEKLQGKSSKGKGARYRKEKRDVHRQKTEDDLALQDAENKLLKVTEFVTVSEVATMMDVPVTQIISACMSLGMMVTMNQRLDAETLTIVASEFDYEVEFINADIEESIQEEEDAPEDLMPRAPIVTVMGHVDHGKTSLLDFIRKENVIAGEAGGITQHIGAYNVQLEDGQNITFLDTPGHEAFTAMRARGAQVTDLAIIVIAADDDIMPQTKEAISHAQAAGVPIVFAINKIDRPAADPEKIKGALAQMNLLVEDWGGKIQSQDISAKKGTGVDDLMEKIVLEAEMLDLKANPNRIANGTVLEASLDKGKGYVTKILVQNGTLKVGDIVLAGMSYGKVKAMYNERNKIAKTAGPATPVLLLGLNSAPQAGDAFRVYKDEKEVKSIASKREQLHREQGVHTQKHITLDEIGRRLAIGDFKELNLIVKGDVDGSIEALSDALVKLSTEEIQVNIIHKSVGQVNEADVVLASASDAIIIAFQVRPSPIARQLAEKEQIDIRTYSVIYKAIDEVSEAMVGMLSPDMVEEITCSVEVRDVFKITKVGTVAGCYVLGGKINRNTRVRVIRDGIVIYSGSLGSLKRFKDDAKEVAKGFECGLNIENFNDIKVNDIIEGYEMREVKRTL